MEDGVVRECWFSKLIIWEGCMVDVVEVYIDVVVVFEFSMIF